MVLSICHERLHVRHCASKLAELPGFGELLFIKIGCIIMLEGSADELEQFVGLTLHLSRVLKKHVKVAVVEQLICKFDVRLDQVGLGCQKSTQVATPTSA